MAIGTAAGMTKRSNGTDSGTDNCRDDAQDTATDKNTRGRQTAADERNCGRGNGNAGKVWVSPSAKILDNTVSHSHMPAMKAKGKSTCGMLHIWKSIKKGFRQ